MPQVPGKPLFLTIPARFFATAGGAGYSPVAPGTAGTLVALVLTWMLRDLSDPHFWLLCALTTALGIAAASAADDCWGTHDSGRIVIDEVAGYFVTVALIDRSDWLLLGVAFLVFRTLDITKPPPVRAIDRRLGGGFGVVLDDVAAGLYGMPLLWGLAELLSR